MKVGDLVRYSLGKPSRLVGIILEIDKEGDGSLILRSADVDMGLPDMKDTHHWWVAWGNGNTHMMSINDIEVVNASR